MMPCSGLGRGSAKAEWPQAVIVLSDGCHNASKTTLPGAVEAAQRADTLVYSICSRMSRSAAPASDPYLAPEWGAAADAGAAGCRKANGPTQEGAATHFKRKRRSVL